MVHLTSSCWKNSLIGYQIFIIIVDNLNFSRYYIECNFKMGTCMNIYVTVFHFRDTNYILQFIDSPLSPYNTNLLVYKLNITLHHKSCSNLHIHYIIEQKANTNTEKDQTDPEYSVVSWFTHSKNADTLVTILYIKTY